MATQDDGFEHTRRGPGREPSELAGEVAFLEARLASVNAQNERLAATLREARDQIVTLKEEIDRLAQPPSGFGTFLEDRKSVV